ncbi:30S ribosome-binding factor RbfA [Buchnera aphidicola (Hormaphis cornu)]|nr:30S ribosome-binding factor RbfA [Buchnera aphidicola (Hormaphis cornu)]
MVIESNRPLRVAQVIKKEVALILKYSIKDPRINFMLSIIDVELSVDLSYAKIYVICINESNKKYIKNIILVLNNARNYIRYLLSKKIQLRKIPKICFHYDNSFIYARKIYNVIDTVTKKYNK